MATLSEIKAGDWVLVRMQVSGLDTSSIRAGIYPEALPVSLPWSSAYAVERDGKMESVRTDIAIIPQGQPGYIALADVLLTLVKQIDGSCYTDALGHRLTKNQAFREACDAIGHVCKETIDDHCGSCGREQGTGHDPKCAWITSNFPKTREVPMPLCDICSGNHLAADCRWALGSADKAPTGILFSVPADGPVVIECNGTRITIDGGPISVDTPR